MAQCETVRALRIPVENVEVFFEIMTKSRDAASSDLPVDGLTRKLAASLRLATVVNSGSDELATIVKRHSHTRVQHTTKGLGMPSKWVVKLETSIGIAGESFAEHSDAVVEALPAIIDYIAKLSDKIVLKAGDGTPADTPDMIEELVIEFPNDKEGGNELFARFCKDNGIVQPYLGRLPPFCNLSPARVSRTA